MLSRKQTVLPLAELLVEMEKLERKSTRMLRRMDQATREAKALLAVPGRSRT